MAHADVLAFGPGAGVVLVLEPGCASAWLFPGVRGDVDGESADVSHAGRRAGAGMRISAMTTPFGPMVSSATAPSRSAAGTMITAGSISSGGTGSSSGDDGGPGRESVGLR